MRLLFPGACSPTAVTETCRRLGEPVDPEQSTTLPSESVALTTATQNLPSRHLDGMPLKRSGLPPERESKRLGAILSIGIACAVVAPIAYFAVGNPFASGSHGFRLRQEIQNAMGLPAVSETVSEAGQSEAARGKQLANAEPPNVVSDKKQPVGQLSHPVPMAIERPAEAVAPALTSRAVPLSPLASAPASLPEQPQPGPGRVMAMRPNGMDPDQIQLLLKQGQEFMVVGDLATARVVLRRAAEAGAVAAAFALAQCYDPKVLTQMHALGVAPDISEARRWYEIAGQLRSAEAACVASSRADRRRPSCPTP
jgi:hypothetical protein